MLEKMGAELRREVESQLLKDLSHYGIVAPRLAIDWSDACQEGHCTEFLGGSLESQSGVAAIGPKGEVVAEGWVDFIHGGAGNPLFVFWLYLTRLEDGRAVGLKQEPNIPDHVWASVPDTTKLLCTKGGAYDAAWHQDPLVLAWGRSSGAA